MAWAIVEFFVLGIIYNFVFIVFGIVAWVKASKPRPYKSILMTGICLNAIPYFGALAGLRRNPEVWSNQIPYLIKEFAFLVLFACLIFYACKKAFKETSEKIEQEKNDAVDKETIPTERRNAFICESCGEIFTGWYQECPRCHTLGKMKKQK